MRTRLAIVPILSLLLLLSSCKQNLTERAVAYNDAIVDIQTRAVGRFDAFVEVADNGDSLAAMQALETALDSVQASVKKLETMEGFEGDNQLRDAAKALILHYEKGLDQDFRGIVGTITNHNSTLPQLEMANEIRDKFTTEEDRLFKEVEAAQKKFAEKYEFKFVGQ